MKLPLTGGWCAGRSATRSQLRRSWSMHATARTASALPPARFPSASSSPTRRFDRLVIRVRCRAESLPAGAF